MKTTAIRLLIAGSALALLVIPTALHAQTYKLLKVPTVAVYIDWLGQRQWFV